MKKHVRTAIKRIVAGKTFFFKMILSGILLGTIPLIIFTIITYRVTTDFAVRSVCDNYKNSLEQLVFGSDKQIGSVIDISRLISENSDIYLYINYDINRIFSTEFISFVQYLSTYKNINSNIESIYLYRGDKVISTDAGMKQIDNFDDGQWCKKIIVEARNNYKYNLPYITDTRTRYNRNNEGYYDYYNIISVICPIGGKNYDEGMVVINIKEDSVREGIEKLRMYQYDQVVVVNKRTGALISKTGDFVDVNDSLILDRLRSYDSKEQVLNISGEKVLVLNADSSIVNWAYIAVSDYDKIINSAGFVIVSTIAAALTLILICVGMSFMVTVRMYSRIKKVVSGVRLEDSITDEMSAIENYIERLSSENAQNVHLLRKNLPVVRENVFNNLIKGIVLTDGALDDINEKLNLCSMGFPYNCYAVAVISIDLFKEFMERYTLNERLNFKYFLLDFIDESLNNIAVTYGMETDSDKLCFIMNLEEEVNVDTIKNAFAEIKKRLYLNTKYSLTVGLGKIYSDMSQIHVSYSEALAALNERLVLGEDQIIYIGDIKNKNESFYTHIKLEEEIFNCLYTGNSERIAEIIDYILKEAKNQGIKSDKVKRILRELISFVEKRLFDTGIVYEEIFKDDNIADDRLESASTLEEMKGCIINTLQKIMTYISNSGNITGGTAVEKVIEYIENNYMHDLSLAKASESVGLSPSYLSTVFGRETKYNFVEYLNLVRINKAKDLLSNTNIPIKEISEMVGYLNYNTFSKVFKKHTGISAKQYRFMQLE